MANKLGGRSHTKDGEDGLQNEALDWDEADDKDGGDNAGEGDGGGARVFPAEKRVEQRVVVGQVLAGGSLNAGCLAGSSQVGELIPGVGGLSASLVSDRAVGKVLHGLGVLDGVHGVGGCCLHC